MRKIYLLFLMLIVPWLHYGQINVSYSWNSGLEGWVSSGAATMVTTTIGCNGSAGSVRTNLYVEFDWFDFYTVSPNNFRSPLLANSTADMVTVSLSYRAVNYSSGEPSSAAPAGSFSTKLQWSTSTTGPWTDFGTSITTPALQCTPYTATFTPSVGDVYIRLVSTLLDEDADIHVYFDELSITQGPPPSCQVPTNGVLTNVSSSSVAFSWSAPSAVPSNGYQYEVRTDTNPGVTGPALVGQGTTAAGVLNASVTTLAPSTAYNVYVRSNCGTNGFSQWVKILSFNTLCSSQNVPYLMPIDATTGTALPQCVTIENLNNDTKFWETTTAQTGITGRVMKYTYNSAQAANDWFYTKGLNLTQGQSYRLKFKFKTSSTSAVEKLKVMLGTGNVSTSMQTQLFDVTTNSANGSSTVEYTIVDFIPQTTGVYYIGFQCYSGANQYTLYVGEISVDLSPTCLVPENLQIANVTKNGAKIEWQAPILIPQTGYEYEIRTSGEPGSGTAGLVQTNIEPNTVLFKNISGLTPSTEYNVYLRSVCIGSDVSIWTLVKTFTTQCNYPDLVSTTPATRCGVGTVGLSADFNSSHVFWFDDEVGGNVLGTLSSFTTPSINANTTYYVAGGNVSATPSLVNAGSGTLTSATYSNPFYSAWSNNHTQHLITARELLNYGVGPGEINSIALDVTSVGTLPMINLSIKIGTSTRSALETFDTNAVMTNVFTSASYLPTAGVNTFVFTTPFVWDGKSNVIIEFCHGNPSSSATMSRTIKSVATPYKSTVKAHVSSSTSAATACANTSTNVDSYLNRPQFIFNANTICVNKIGSPVIATVTPAPVLTLSTTSVEICEGQNSTVTVTAGASDYNTFVWSPTTGVTGNATTGWTFNPTESTVYTLTATQTSGSLCASIIDVNVNVNPLPLMLDLGGELQACAGNVLQLKVGDNTVWPSNYFNSFETTALQGFVLAGTGVTAATTTLVSSVGSRSLNMVTVSSANGYVTLSNSLNLTGFTSPYLTFDHIAAMEGAGDYSYDFGYVEYSLDGGSTWILFKPADYVGGAQEIGSSATVGQRFSTRSYADWKLALTGSSSEPTNALWKTERFNLPTGADLSNVKIRFRATSDSGTNYKGWFIDNVNIKEAPITTAIWSPVTNLYTDALATVPYVAGANAAMVYFKSDVAMAETDYTVTVVSQAGCTVSQTVAITNTFVATPVALAQSFCEEIEVTNIVVTGLTTGATLKWFETATSTTEVTTISTTGTYYVVQELNGCASVRVPVDIAINSITVAPVTNQSQVFCGDYTVADLVATSLPGNTIGWFNSETSVVPMNLTDQLVSGVYYVSQYNGSCWSPRATVTVSVNPVPAAPVAIAQNFCGTRPLSEINLGQVSNATLKWYETSTSVVVLPITTQLATGTYYVSQMINGCESSRVAIPVIIQDVLPAPVAPSSQLYCGTTLISDLAATSVSNGIIGWFSSLTSTTPIASTQNVSTGTYYVAQFNGACWSPRTTVNVTVNPKPAAPSNATIHLCGNYNFGQVSIGQVSGATIKWYATETSTTPINPGTNVVGGSYYVSQTVGGCESDRVMVNIFQTDALSNPTAVSQSFCGSATVADLVAQGTNGTIVWFNSSVALNPLSPNAALTTGTYYAAQTINGCISARVPISVFVVSVAAPNVDTFNFCGSATVADLVLPTPTGVVYKWFNSPSNPVQLDANTALVTGTYFVSRSQYGCESLRTPVIVNINSVPDAPTGVSPQVFIQGSTINDIVMNQPNVVWYMTQQDARNGVNPLVQGMPLVNGTTYYGVIIGTNGCPSLPFALTVDVYLSDDKFVKEELKYYPNPVEDILTVSYSDRILLIEVFDLLGKRVKVKSTDDKEVNIDLSDLASGTYMIQLKTENKAQFLKIIKK